MIKRILVVLPGIGRAGPVHRCLAELAPYHNVSMTGVVSIDAEAWKNVLPDPMSAGYAARLLEAPPWSEALESIERSEAQFVTFCRQAGLDCTTQRPDGEPAAALAVLAQFYDLLIAGLPPVLDLHTDQALERALCRSGGSGIPVLRPSLNFRRIARVLLLLTEDSCSIRALRSFLQLRLLPSVEATLATVGHALPSLDLAADYCASHGLVAHRQLHLPNADDVLSWTRQEAIDLVVTGWSWLHRSGGDIHDSPSLFLLP